MCHTTNSEICSASVELLDCSWCIEWITLSQRSGKQFCQDSGQDTVRVTSANYLGRRPAIVFWAVETEDPTPMPRNVC